MRSGVHLIKFWFSVSRAGRRRRRFKEHENHPFEAVEAQPIDMASLDKWEDYTRAKESMFFETDTGRCPWTVIKSDCKTRARLNAMRYVLHKLPMPTRIWQIGKLDPRSSAVPTWCTSAVSSRALFCSYLYKARLVKNSEVCNLAVCRVQLL